MAQLVVETSMTPSDYWALMWPERCAIVHALNEKFKREQKQQGG